MRLPPRRRLSTAGCGRSFSCEVGGPVTVALAEGDGVPARSCLPSLATRRCRDSVSWVLPPSLYVCITSQPSNEQGVGTVPVGCVRAFTHAVEDCVPADTGGARGPSGGARAPSPSQAQQGPLLVSSQLMPESGCLTSIKFELILAGFLYKNIQVLIVSPNYWTATQI